MADRATSAAPLVRLAWSQVPELWLLRLRRECAPQLQPAATALGIALPAVPGESAGSAHCTAPGEWLLEGDHSNKGKDLEAALSGAPFLLTAIGSGLARLDVTGPAAADLLNKGCSLDLHPAAFPTGRCTRTLLAGIAVAVVRPAIDEFRLYLDLSLSTWLREWCDEASREFAFEGALR